MNPEDIGRILDEIGERIGPAGEYAWTLAVRQVYTEGILGTIFGGLLMVALVVLIIGVILYIGRAYSADKARERGVYDSFDPVGYVVVGGMAAGFGGLAVGGLFAWFYASLLQLLNPEYHAMIRLLERVVPQ